MLANLQLKTRESSLLADFTDNHNGNGADGSDLQWLIELVFAWNAKENPDRPLEVDYDEIPWFFENLRDDFDRYQAGNPLSLLDALRTCIENSIVPPAWVLTGYENFFVTALTSGKGFGGKGRGNNPLARTRDSIKRYKRFETVSRVRYAQKMRKAGIDIVYKIAVPDEVKIALNKGLLKDIGNTFHDAVTAAEIGLRGTFAQASFATIEKNFRTYYQDEFHISNETQFLLGLASEDKPIEFEGITFRDFGQSKDDEK